jgi:hypothetical protein
VIIFDSVRFLPIKITKPNFFILKNQNWTEIESNRPVSIRFGYFILKTKNYIVFWFFFCNFQLVWFRFSSVFFGFGLVWFFSFKLMEPKPNWTGWFLKYSNQLNWFFFHGSVFSVIFFSVFSVQSVFLVFLLTPTLIHILELIPQFSMRLNLVLDCRVLFQ